MINKLIFGGSTRRMVAYSQKKYEEGNVMYYFAVLNGIDVFKIATAPGERHDYKLVIDTIHEYQARHPNKAVKEGYSAAISKSISAIKKKKAIVLILDYLNYELEKQRNGTSSFRLDYARLLQELKNKIIEIQDVLRAEDANFDRWLSQNIESIEERSIRR